MFEHKGCVPMRICFVLRAFNWPVGPYCSHWTHVGNRWCLRALEDPPERNLCTSLSEVNKFTLIYCLPLYRIPWNLIRSLKCNRLRPTIFIFCLAGSERTSFISYVGCLDDEIVLKNGSWREEPFIWKGFFRDVWHRTYCTSTNGETPLHPGTGIKTPFLVNCIVVCIICTNHGISVGKNSKT